MGEKGVPLPNGTFGRKIDRPRIDFDIVNVMEPMTIAGAVLGSLINKVLPGWLLTVLLMVVLGAITLKTTFSGKARWNKETKERELIDSLKEKFKQENAGRDPDQGELEDLIAEEKKAADIK